MLYAGYLINSERAERGALDNKPGNAREENNCNALGGQCNNRGVAPSAWGVALGRGAAEMSAADLLEDRIVRSGTRAVDIRRPKQNIPHYSLPS